MPDLSDVEAAMARIVTTVLYPNGLSEASVIGAVCRVYRGWPSPTTLNTDLANGTVNVTVAPDSDVGNTTTRFALEWAVPGEPPTLVADAEDTSVTLSGIGGAGQSIGVLVDSATYIYRVQDGDTPAIVAAVLAAMIRSTRPAHLQGASISVPGAYRVIARVVRDGRGFKEVRRQQRDLRVISWCPSPELRDRVSTLVDHAFAARDFLEFPDEITARLTYRGTSVYDQAQNSQLFRRDLIYTVEYPTILEDQIPAMLFGDLALNTARFIA